MQAALAESAPGHRTYGGRSPEGSVMTTSLTLSLRRNQAVDDVALVLRTLLTFIASVSAYDIYLTYKLRDVILGTEQNPLCWWLISLEPTQLSVFIPCKLLGTAFVVAFCGALSSRSPRHGVVISAGVAAFQAWLLCYLQL